MSDNVSKKEFVKILAQYIKYIEKKIKNEINQLESSDNNKNYELEALNKVSKSLLNYKEEIKKEANKLADTLCNTKRDGGTGSVEEDAKKINDIKKSLNETLEKLLNSYKKWFSNSLNNINKIFTKKDEDNLSKLNNLNRRLEITFEEDERRKTLKKYKEIKNNSLKIFFKYLTDPSDKDVIKGILDKIEEEYKKQEKNGTRLERVEFKIEEFSCETAIENLKNNLEELEKIYSKYKDGEIYIENSDSDFDYSLLFDEKGKLSLTHLYAYLLYKDAYKVFKEEVEKEENKLKDLKDHAKESDNDRTPIGLKQIKENIYSKKSELNKAREEYNKRPTSDNKYKIGDLKKELAKLETTKKDKENEIEEQTRIIKDKQNNFIENSYLKYYDMENEMIKIPFDFPFDTITPNKKDSGEIESIKFEHKKELTLSKEETFENLGQIESKEDELYGLVEVFEAFCYLYRIIAKNAAIINNHINLYNNALLSRTNENSLYSILEKIEYVYKTEINDYLSKKDQDLYIENEWDFIFNKTEDKENGRNYWGTEFSDLKDIEISKKRNEFKEFIKEAVIKIKEKGNPLKDVTKIKKYEQKILDNNEFYKNNFRKIDGCYCFYLKDILSSFKIGENFVTTKDIVLGPLLDKTGMKEKKDILYYKKINKSLEGDGNIKLVIKKYWLKDINLNISKRDIDLYDYSKEIENSFKSLINNKL